MERILLRLFGFIFVLLLLGLASCDSRVSSKSFDDVAPFPLSISGTVRGSGGLAGVTVSAGDRQTTTDANGFYELSDVDVPPGGRLVLTYAKPGYGTYQRAVQVKEGGRYAVDARLLGYQYSQAKDLSVAQTIDVDDGGAGPLVTLDLPEGSVNAAGPVVVNIATGDPTTADGRAVFPGDFMAAASLDDDPTIPLESVAYTEITMTDSLGGEIDTLDEPATLTVRLPEAFQAGGARAGTYAAGDTIEWWSYDEDNATWIREDAEPGTPELDDADVVAIGGVLYARAKVTHFSWWNADRPIDQHAVLCVRVEDGQGNPVSAQVIAEGVTYDGRSTPASTDANGRACVTVKRSTETVQERVRLYVEAGGVRFGYDVTEPSGAEPAEGDAATDELFTPTVSGSTIANTGTFVDLRNPIAVRFDGRITGTVTHESTGAPVAGFIIFTNYGERAMTGDDGSYALDAPVGIPLTLFAAGLVSQSVTVSDAVTPVVVNFQVPNRDPVIGTLSRTPQGVVGTGARAELSVQASDPDGDPVTVTWSLDGAGSLNRTTSASVTWSAPASGAGTDTVTVTVRDDKGGEVSQSVVIVWGGGVSGGQTNLVLHMKDDLANDQPVSGVVVALYETDNRTIDRVVTTGPDGLADFGDIGRNRASVTVVLPATRRIETYFDIPVSEMVYYVSEDPDQVCSIATAPTVDVGFGNAPADTALGVEPFFSGLVLQDGQRFGVCPEDIQDDDRISPLATAKDNGGELLAYGYLLDQTFTGGTRFELDFDREPKTVIWSSEDGTPVQVAYEGWRKGVAYFDRFAGLLTTPATSGAFRFPGEFPFDYVEVMASGGQFVGGLWRIAFQRFRPTLPDTVSLALPDYQIGNPRFDDQTATFSWTLGGSAARDYLLVNIEGDSLEQGMVDWQVVMSPDASNWRLMELPPPANGWIDITDLRGSGVVGANLLVADIDTLNGLDELVSYLGSGNSPETPSAYNQLRMGAAPFDIGIQPLTAQALAAPDRALAGFPRRNPLDHLQRR